MNKKLIRNDILLILSIIAVIVVLAFFIYKPSNGDTVSVMYDGKELCTLSLNKNTSFKVENTGVTVCIKDGKAFIESSDCPDKLCVHTPAIDQNSPDNSSIVCLPNKTAVIKNSGKTNKEADVIAG